MVNGYARRTLPLGSIDLLIRGIGADTWMLGYLDDAGVHAIVQGAVINYREMLGAFDTDGMWRGTMGPISYEQTVTLNAARSCWRRADQHRQLIREDEV